jgi:hypothetical protein
LLIIPGSAENSTGRQKGTAACYDFPDKRYHSTRAAKSIGVQGLGVKSAGQTVAGRTRILGVSRNSELAINPI